MPDKTARGTVLIAKDGRLCVLRDSLDDSLVFVQLPWNRSFQPLVDYNGVNRGTVVSSRSRNVLGLELLEGNVEMIGQAIWEWSNSTELIQICARRVLIMDLLAMTFEQTDSDLKPSRKFQFYAAELTDSNGGATQVRDEDCLCPYRPPEHRLLDFGDKVFLLAAKHYRSFMHVYSALPMRPTREVMYVMSGGGHSMERMTPDQSSNSLRKTGGETRLCRRSRRIANVYHAPMLYAEPTDSDCGIVSLSEQIDSPSSPQGSSLITMAEESDSSPPSGERDLVPLLEGSSSNPLKDQPTISQKRKRTMTVILAVSPNTSTTPSATNAAIPSTKQRLPNPSNEEDQDDEETLPASKLEDEVPYEAQPEAQPRTPAQREGAGKAKIATRPVGDTSSVVRSAEENEDMDAEDIDLEMRTVELEQRNVELEQRKIRLHQMRRALEKKKQLHKEG